MLKIPTQVRPRVESGPIQFDEDWPGIFIRGDQAMGCAMALRQVLDDLGPVQNWPALCELRNLVELLESCSVHRRNG